MKDLRNTQDCLLLLQIYINKLYLTRTEVKTPVFAKYVEAFLTCTIIKEGLANFVFKHLKTTQEREGMVLSYELSLGHLETATRQFWAQLIPFLPDFFKRNLNPLPFGEV